MTIYISNICKSLFYLLCIFVIFLFLLTKLYAKVKINPELIDIYSKWEAYTYGNNQNKVCYIGSQPLSSEGNYTRRGKVYAMVAHRPGLKIFNEVSIMTGYTYKKYSEVNIEIDSQNFNLFTHNDSAWALNSEEDSKLVNAMKSGLNMVIIGYSSRGTKTIDTYSLSGFTKAYNTIVNKCFLKHSS